MLPKIFGGKVTPSALMHLSAISRSGSYEVFVAEDATLAVMETRRLKTLGHAMSCDEITESGKVIAARVTHYTTCKACETARKGEGK